MLSFSIKRQTTRAGETTLTIGIPGGMKMDGHSRPHRGQRAQSRPTRQALLSQKS
jgi:hypothetical protein